MSYKTDESVASLYNLISILFSELSPERIVSVAENTSDNSCECPEELYNLTKLAEVAAAAGQILDNRTVSITPSSASDEESSSSYVYTHKLFDKTSRTPRAHLIKVSYNNYMYTKYSFDK